jgi:hypothetical protein
MHLRGQMSCSILHYKRKYIVFAKKPDDIRHRSSFVFRPFVGTEYEEISEIVFRNLVSYVASVSFL